MNLIQFHVLVSLLALAIAEAAAQAPEFTSQFRIEDCHFSPFGGQPYFILNPGHQLVLQGEEDGEAKVLTITALNETKEITLTNGNTARKITARVVEERETVDGELAELSRNWYARCLETGDIFYFGEEVDFYEDGQVTNHQGSWEAGVNGARPGIIMPGTFLLGARYFQEVAPGAAMDQAENLTLGVAVTNEAGVFLHCVSVRESNPLEPDAEPEVKVYAPGVGLVSDAGALKLQQFRLGAVGVPAGCTFVPYSSNPLFPFAPGRRLVLEGEEDGETIRLEIVVLDETRQIALPVGGEQKLISTRVIEERESVDGELAEISRNFYAQCLETGDVFYFGEEVDFYEEGEISGHAGSWLAGVSNAQPGVIMPGHFTVGAQYFQERAPGLAEDFAVNSGIDLTRTVPAGTFTGCVAVTESNLLEPDSEPEEKIYAPGIGLISDAGVLVLTEVTPPTAANTPVLAVQDALLLTWPVTSEVYGLQCSANLDNWSLVPHPPVSVDGRNQVTLPRDSVRSFFRLSKP